MNISRRVRWGILGVAKINDRLLPAFAKARNAELITIASRSIDKAREAAAAADIPNAYGSYEALLDDARVDAVYIPLPNTLHGEWTRKAADRGKHVLCEKPLTPTAAEALALVNYCRSKGVLLMDGFMWPHHPRTARLRECLDSGTIGAIRRLGGAFTYPMRPLDPDNIRLHAGLAGGSLLDVGCYPVYGIRWAFGSEPTHVFATAKYEHGVDVEMNGILWFSDGRIGTFDCGFTLPLRGWLEITGTDGTVRVHDMWLPGDEATFHTRQQDDEVVFVVHGEDQIVHMIEDFGRSVLDGTQVKPDPEEAVRTLRVLDALAKSAREKREVQVAGSGNSLD